MTFVFVGPNHSSIDGDMVGHQGVRDYAFFQPEVFGRIPRIDGVEACLKLLAVTAGMDSAADIILPKNRQFGCGIADPWVFRTLTLACSHATFLVLPYENDCNPKGSISTKRQ